VGLAASKCAAGAGSAAHSQIDLCYKTPRRANARPQVKNEFGKPLTIEDVPIPQPDLG
jgi:hypothetical protein